MQDKLKINAYKDSKYSSSPLSSIEVIINPSSYSHDYKVNYDEKVQLGASGTPLTFGSIPPETISFDIYFDATGAIDVPESIDKSKLAIDAQVTLFKEVCFDYNGDIHEPNYLIINWGSLVFKCKLTSLKIDYNLFQKDGTPLRAKASCSFTEAIDLETIIKDASRNSPDLTHLIEIKEGDRLPIICNEVYGDPSYYIEVAKFNNLVNFRELIPGTKLYLPPIK